MEQEGAEHAGGVVIGALALAEAEGGLEQGVLLGVEAVLGEAGLGPPGFVGVGRDRHESPSRATGRE